jgi:hypothetical protein
MTSEAALMKAAAGFAAVALLGCPTPRQEGGLAAVDVAGFAARVQILCRSGHADPSCAPPIDAGSADGPSEDAGTAAPSDSSPVED